jgi:outer membrane receptor protein involved in Fe transport
MISGETEKRCFVVALLCLSMLFPFTALGEDEVIVAPIEVVTGRPLTAASERTVRDRDFLLLPRQTASDLLLNVPHLHISQHSGGGKGHQIFMRGYDAEHGEDLAIYLEGVPINLPSHIHGIGYADLHFLIPEAVRSIHIIKGPYDLRYGDFSVAGAVDFEVRKSFSPWQLASSYGRFHTFSERLHISVPKRFPVFSSASAEYFRTDGFTRRGTWDGARYLGKTGVRIGPSTIHMLLGAYVSQWQSADTIPASLVSKGKLGFYDGIDSSDGGQSHRFHASLHQQIRNHAWQLENLVYAVHSKNQIFSDYTYFLKYPDSGDQTEQSDNRLYFGAKSQLARVWLTGFTEFTLRAGAEYRTDLTKIRQWQTVARKRWDTVTNYEATIHTIGGYLGGELKPLSWLRLSAGSRYDHFIFNLAGTEDLKRPSSYIDQDVHLAGTADAGIFSPKAAIIFSPLSQWSVFINFGRGFHSPDARDIVRNPGTKMPDAYAGEISTRIRIAGQFDLAAACWFAWTADELFFDPDLGRSIGQGASRRVGGEVEARWSPVHHLLLFADVGSTDARLTSGNPVVGSPRWMATGGAAWHDFHGFRGSVRSRYIGPRPLDLSRMSKAACILDLTVGWEYRWLAFDLTVENLLNSRWKDAQFYYVSRPTPESPPAAGYHFTPGTPFSARGTLTLQW